jgi:hypothetical protein
MHSIILTNCYCHALQVRPCGEITVYLFSIYDKSAKENLTDKELDEQLNAMPK